MEKFIPYEKLSKKNKRELNAKRRQTWSISPVTRKPANPKAYNRQKARKRIDDPDTVSFVFPSEKPCGIAPTRRRGCIRLSILHYTAGHNYCKLS